MKKFCVIIIVKAKTIRGKNMKFFEGMQKFFESISEYIKNFSNLFFIFIGAFALVSIVIIIMTSFAYECKMTKTIDKINKFLERNPRINDDNLVAFNNMMKASNVPKTLRRQWQQFMLYREHSASYYMSFKHCVENPLRNSTYNQQMTVYRIISYVLVVLSLVISAFMATPASFTSVLQEILVIPILILVLYWLISMILNLIHSAISGDLFQNYQYFEINMDKAMLTLPEFVDYEVLFSQDEIRRGIPVLFAYLQKRAIQEQQELEKARLKSVDHEKFDFDKAGLDGSLVLDRAMRETENFSAQRKKYMQEIERVNNEISVLQNNYKEQTKEFQRQVQTSKETVENLKEQLEQASSTIEINYIKKQMRDELNRQQMAEKEFDILTDKHNQEVKSLQQEIKHYDEETQKAKEALEVAMLSEFNTYSVKVYDNLEKIVDDKMQDKVDEYKDQIKGLEVELEEKNEELENVYTRYQEVLSQLPEQVEEIDSDFEDDDNYSKKGKNKKKKKFDEQPEGMEQPPMDEFVDEGYPVNDYQQDYTDYSNQANDFEQYDNYQQYNDEYFETEGYNDNFYDEYQNEQYQDYQYEDVGNNPTVNEFEPTNEYLPAEEQFVDSDMLNTYVPLTEDFNQNEFTEQVAEPVFEDAGEYVPLNQEYQPSNEEYVPLNEEYQPSNEEYVPLNDEYKFDEFVYEPQNNFSDAGEYVPLADETVNNFEDNSSYEYVPETKFEEEYVPLAEEQKYNNEEDFFNFDDANNVEFDSTPVSSSEDFDESDFDIDFTKPVTSSSEFEDMDFDFDLGSEEPNKDEEPAGKEVKFVDDEDFDLNKILGLYDDVSSESKKEASKIKEDEAEEEVPSISESVITDISNLVDDKKQESDSDDVTNPVNEETNELAQPVVKRKAGRPRKVVEEGEIQPKRPVGRPRKVVEEGELDKPKRKAGRPRKVVEEGELDKPKRKAGRPRKTQSEVLKTSVGRPRKEENDFVLSKPKRPVGRPRKVDAEGTKRPVGRPRKTDTGANTPKRPVGRPRKTDTGANAPKRPVGRPRKQG